MKRAKHSLSHYRLLTGDMGELLPIGLVEVLPGDSIQQATSLLLRVSPLLSPVMHPVDVRIHHWFVPHRLVWNDWENFITGGPDGLNASTFPTYTVNTGTGFAIGSLADYLGLPTGVDDIAVSALPFRGYSLIWNEWYRDQDLDTALTIDKTDGADVTTNVDLQNIRWEKDRFTSARPWTQKGTAVSLPLGTRANVKPDSTSTISGVQPGMILRDLAGDLPPGDRSLNTTAGGALQMNATAPGANPAGLYISNLYADLSGATAASINDLREAFALQKYKEARAIYGSRYTEYLRYLGVRSSDARLQRPEYLGGGRQTIQFSEVLQTGVTTSGTPSTGVGSLLGHGIAALRSNRYRRFFEEHGYIFSLLSVRPKTMYFQGLDKHWFYSTKEDIFQKELQHIGQQEILNKEIYAADSGPTDVFGYQDRYDQYRRMESKISGEFRSTLNHWHMGREFSGDVTLNGTFVNCNATKRILQAQSADGLWIMANHSIQSRRIVDKFGTPIGY